MASPPRLLGPGSAYDRWFRAHPYLDGMLFAPIALVAFSYCAYVGHDRGWWAAPPWWSYPAVFLLGLLIGAAGGHRRKRRLGL